MIRRASLLLYGYGSTATALWLLGSSSVAFTIAARRLRRFRHTPMTSFAQPPSGAEVRAESTRRRAPLPPLSSYGLHLRDVVRPPGLLSLSRIPLAMLFPLVPKKPRYEMGLLLLAGATDVLDGWCARRYGHETHTGALLDGAADKIFVLTVVGSLVASRSMTLREAVLLGTRELGELALAMRVMSHGRRAFTKPRSADMYGKWTTALQYASIVAVITKSSLRKRLVIATALAGVLSSIAYFGRERRIERDSEHLDAVNAP